MSVENLKAGFAVENCPRILETYLFCCPALDGNFRCLPKAGGFYDQDYADILGFRLIEQRLAQIASRKAKRKDQK